MLYGLYFVTCLVENPAHCVTRLHAFSDEINGPRQCLSVAQPQMARWVNAHPTWRVERWRCGAPPRDTGTRI